LKAGRDSILPRNAIVVAGHTLLLIGKEKLIKDAFLSITDDVDVVLACRVSPK
jgi:hypothetical protein